MKSRAGSGKDFSEFLLVIGGVMACVITPVFVVFLHSIYKVHLYLQLSIYQLTVSPWELIRSVGLISISLPPVILLLPSIYCVCHPTTCSMMSFIVDHP